MNRNMNNAIVIILGYYLTILRLGIMNRNMNNAIVIIIAENLKLP